MIPTNQGSILFHGSSLNRTPRENFYISSYEGPNGISSDVPYREHNVFSMVKVSYMYDQTVTRGSPYNFTILNSPITGHRGKRIINPNWWNQFWWNLWFWIRYMWGYLSAKFQIYRSINFIDITETIARICVEEIGKFGLLVQGASLHCFQKRSTLDSSIWRDLYFYPIIS